MTDKPRARDTLEWIKLLVIGVAVLALTVVLFSQLGGAE
jgi:hypothetical protein